MIFLTLALALQLAPAPAAPGDTTLLVDINQVTSLSGSEPSELTPLGTRVFFAADDGEHGRELWVTDGTPGGTALVLDLRPGPAGSAPESLTAFGDRLFFFADDGVHGAEPFVTDGTVAGTLPLADVAPGAAGSDSIPVRTIVFDGKVFFTAVGGAGDGIWSTDGTPAGTRELDVPGFDLVHAFTPLHELDGALYFVGLDPAIGFELFRSDGTSAGTSLVVDLFPGPNPGVDPTGFASLDGQLYFAGTDGTTNGGELFRTDGTAEGTELVEDLVQGSGSFPALFTRVGDFMVFTHFGADTFQRVASTNGVDPVVELAFVPPGVLQIFTDGELAYFWSSTPIGEPQLWRTDGTAAGTSILFEPQVPVFIGKQAFSAAGNGPITVFAAEKAGSGFEIFRTDGTRAGTEFLVDVAAGDVSSGPTDFTRLGNQVLFTAFLLDAGRELHSIPLVDVGDWVLELYGNACAGSSGISPTLSASGTAAPGASFSVDLTGAAPSSSGWLLLGFEPVANPIGACALDVADPVFLHVTTNALGARSLNVTPDPSLVGLAVFAEFAILDPGGELFGMASKSRALEIVVGR